MQCLLSNHLISLNCSSLVHYAVGFGFKPIFTLPKSFLLLEAAPESGAALK